MKYSRLIVNGKKKKLNLNQNAKIFFHENAFGNANHFARPPQTVYSTACS